MVHHGAPERTERLHTAFLDIGDEGTAVWEEKKTAQFHN